MEYTREQALAVHNDWKEYHLQHDFTFRFEDFLNEKFKPQIEVGKWYKNDFGYKYLVLDFQDNNKFKGCVVDSLGRWLGISTCIDRSDFKLTPMTENEIFEVLKKEAIKRGYKDGNYKCMLEPCALTAKLGDDVNYYVNGGDLWIDGSGCSNKIFDGETGEWAKIICPIDEEIKELEQKIENLKSKQCK